MMYRFRLLLRRRSPFYFFSENQPMKACVYREYRGQSCTSPDGHLWCAKLSDPKELTVHELEAGTKEDALAEAAKIFQIDESEIESK